MKSSLFFLLMTAATSAYATKARLQSLNSSFHLIDTQTVYTAPLDLLEQANFIDIESGNTNPTSTTDNAEGLINYSLTEKSRVAFAVGHLDDAVMVSRSVMNSILGATYAPPQNAINIMYANKQSDEFAYSFGFYYSNFKDKFNQLTNSSQSAVLGLQFESIQIYNTFVLLNSVEAATAKKFDGAGTYNLYLAYSFDTYTFALNYLRTKAQSSTNSVEDQSHEMNRTDLVFVDSNKKEGNDFFYGLTLTQIDVKDRLFDHTFKRIALPVNFGLEVQASDLLTLRGSISQSFILSQSKEDVTTGTAYPAGTFSGSTGGASDFQSEPNDTNVNIGAGLKWKNINLDGTLVGMTGAAQNQQLDFNNLFGQVGLVYNY